MANIWYPKGLEAVLKGDVDLENDTIKAVLVDSTDYTYNVAHDFLDDVPSGARCTSGTATLGSKAVTTASNVNKFDAADPTLTSVPGSQGSFDLLIVYKDSGVEGTSQLLLKNDLSAAVTPNGGNITLQFDAGGIGTVTATGA